MTFVNKNRLFLLSVAVIPPLLIMLVVYFSTIKQVEKAELERITNNVNKFGIYYHNFKISTLQDVDRYAASSKFQQAVRLLYANRAPRIDFSQKTYGLDFIELLNNEKTVIASNHRPGLIGQPYPKLSQLPDDESETAERVEYDIEGAHAAYVVIKQITPELYMVTGRYLDDRNLIQLTELIEAKTELFFENIPTPYLKNMNNMTLYKSPTYYTVCLTGSKEIGFRLMAAYPVGKEKPIFMSLLKTTAAVAALSVLAAILFGLYFAQKTKREINNLVEAASRVAAGDFNKPVMAYEESEFSTLADAFTDMMHRLKVLQKQLTTSEKIAAWQTVGRKIAHELKNPLTPISISVEDLNRTYYDNHPEFEKTLNDTTKTVKSEIHRMNTLLNEFVSFARMKESEIKTVNKAEFIKSLKLLYQNEEINDRIDIDDRIKPTNIKIDPDTIKQTLINLIKNGLESKEGAKVIISFDTDDSNLIILIEDNGPGFPEHKLRNSFEPYVTTKTDGTGLGLVISHRIINDHRGTMELYNHSNGGGIRIKLPQ